MSEIMLRAKVGEGRDEKNEFYLQQLILPIRNREKYAQERIFT